MKILHTSDLHIGKKLYNQELAEEQRMFFAYLTGYINENGIDVLLVSGDVFDLANPSGDARKLYYEFLAGLINVKCKVIITGGNHDSPNVLNAPKDILKLLDIHIIGQKTTNPEEMIIPVEIDGNFLAVIAAVPYLRESDLRRFSTEITYEEAQAESRSGIIEFYSSIKNLANDKFPGIPVIAMGHLFIAGAAASDSERELRIGNIDKIESENFYGLFDYFAIGHIHKPYSITDDKSIAYSGSPYPLSFSEYDDKKRMIELEIKHNEVNIKSVELPKFRNLLKICGDFFQIQNKLESYDNSEYQLIAFAEAELLLEENSQVVKSDFESYIQGFQNENISVLKHKITNKAQADDIAEQYDTDIQIEDLQPTDVFKNRIENEDISDEDRKMLEDAFLEVLDLVHRGEE